MQLKNLFKITVAILILSSCSGGSKENVKDRTSDLVPNPEGEAHDKPGVVEEAKSPAASSPGIPGLYVGMFDAVKVDEKKLPMYSNKISLFIDSVGNNHIFGHSVVAGNSRTFKGTITSKTETEWIVEAREPGDNKYDGMFSFTVTPAKESVSGKWIANDKNLAVTERKYTLEKKQFAYNPEQKLEGDYTSVYNPYNSDSNEGEFITDAAMKINASTTPLKKEDVENMYKRDLEVMRNAIYARHGYSFKNREMRYFFDNNVAWYIPFSTDVTKELTTLEKKNIELIKRYEEHATAYYDSFGR